MTLCAVRGGSAGAMRVNWPSLAAPLTANSSRVGEGTSSRSVRQPRSVTRLRRWPSPVAVAYGLGVLESTRSRASALPMRIESIALIPFLALSMVSSPFFGQNLGAGLIRSHVHEARRVALRFCARRSACCSPSGSADNRGHILSLELFTESRCRVRVRSLWACSSGSSRRATGPYGLAMVAIDSFNGSGGTDSRDERCRSSPILLFDSSGGARS